MKKEKIKNVKKIIICCALILIAVSLTFSQKRVKVKPTAKLKTIVFAVIDDGGRIEPIAEIDKGKLVQTVVGDSDEKSLLSFSKNYYKPKTAYNLIFGGAKNGTVTIVDSNPKSDCGKNAATVTTQSTKAKLKGLVMGLATNDVSQKTASGLRRLPTPTERSEIESLVRAEFVKQGISANVVKTLKYHNLTALDVDNDGMAELVGSFWAENSATERNLLFFIAEKNKSGKYDFGYSEYQKITPDKVMSGELKNLDDDAMLNELLLDTLDYNGDKTAEVFTVVPAIEGYNYNVYSRQNGKWTKVFEGSNYHCAF